ncbi:Integrase/recombinase (fragment) (plasmid) [Cupriavidus taiwanensis]
MPASVFAGVRQDNPAATLLTAERWPAEEPTPQFLTEADDRRLQAYLKLPPDDLASLRSEAIVAAFLGTGITAAEARAARCADLWTEANPPYLLVRAHGVARCAHDAPG